MMVGKSAFKSWVGIFMSDHVKYMGGFTSRMVY